MTLTDLQNTVNGNNLSYHSGLFINKNNENNLEKIEQTVPFRLSEEDNSNIYDLPYNQLITRKFAKNYIAKSTNNKYKVLIYDDIYQNYNGTLEDLFNKIFGLRLKKNVNDIILNVFLVGGGSSGSCMRKINVGLPVPGETVYRTNLKFKKNHNIKISIGKGGRSIPASGIKSSGIYITVDDEFISGSSDANKALPFIQEIGCNNGASTKFNNIEAYGGQKNFIYKDSDQQVIIDFDKDSFYGSYGKELINENYYTADMNFQFLKNRSTINNLSGKNLIIPYTNIEVCTNGISTCLGESGSFTGESHDLKENVYGGKSAGVFYEFYLKNNFSKKTTFKTQGYSGDYLFECTAIEGQDNLSYGGSGSGATVTPFLAERGAYANKGYWGTIVASEYFRKAGIPEFQSYDFYRGRIGAGGQGCCAIIVRSDYFES